MRLSDLIPILSLAALLSAGGTAATQPAPAPATAQKPIDTVTVTGARRADPDRLRTVITPFVAKYAAPSAKSGLVPRAPPQGVCPLSIGLSDAFDRFVSERIVTVAKSVGAPVQNLARCRPNVEVVFTDQPQILLDRLARRTFDDVLGVETRPKLARVSRPIQAWYMTGTVSPPSTYDQQSGVANFSIGDKSFSASPPTDVVLDRNYGRVPQTGTGSHLSPANSSQIMNALILVDTNRVDGLEIGPIADYVAVLALSHAQLRDDCGELPSILDLMAPSCTSDAKPQTLTDSDTAFLKALYAADITSSGRAARDRIAKAMAKGLDAAKRSE